MNTFPLTFTIPTDSKDLEFVYWMRPFTVDTLATRYRLNTPYSCLYMQKVISYQDRQNSDPSARKSLSFQITRKNLGDIQDAFAKVSDWFSEEGIKELYGVNDQGGLMFNMEYRDLKITIADEFAGTREALQIVPAPVEIGKGVLEPGVILFINRQENAIVLRKYQIVRLIRFIRDFSFVAYDQFAMTCFQYSLSLGNVLSQEEVNRIANNQKGANSNFKTY